MSTTEFLQTRIDDFFRGGTYSLASQLSTLVMLDTFWYGLVLGVQQDTTDTTSECYTSFGIVYTFITTYGVDFYTYAEAVVNKGSTPTDVGFLMNMFEAFSQFNLVFFNLYADCYFELLLIAIGQITSSQAQGGQFLMTIGVTIYEYFYEGVGNMVNLDTSVQAFAADSTNTVLAQDVGLKLGAVIQEMIMWQVPNYTVNKFEKA